MNLQVFEPLWRPDQVVTQPGFFPFDNRTNPRSSWREIAIYVAMYERGLHRDRPLTGMLSPKFQLKAGLTDKNVFAHIEGNPGHDVYLFNPGPHLGYICQSSWMNASFFHPGIIEIAKDMFDAAGFDFGDIATQRQSLAKLCYCNYWVGGERFWDEYVGGVLVPLYYFVVNNPDAGVVRKVMSPTDHTTEAPFLPFIVENLLSTYLERSTLSVSAYQLDPFETCHLPFERDIVATLKNAVDAADAAGVFPTQLREMQDVFSRLRLRYIELYYKTNVHPHTGRINEPVEGAADVIAELELRPVPALG